MNDAPPAIDSPRGFALALRWGLRRAVELEARRICFVDAGFEAWPLDDAESMRTLADWLRRPDRRLCLLAGSYEEVPRRWPRFVAWRRHWAHAVEAWQAPAEVLRALPTLLLTDTAVSVHLIDSAHWRGRAAEDVRRATQWREQVDAILQRSELAFAVNTLGL